MPITKVTLRGSNRLKENDKRKIVDETARKRRQRKLIELYEADNFHDDPHADLVMSKKVPKFDENLESRTRTKKKERTPEYYQMKYSKPFPQLVEEDKAEAEKSGRISYVEASKGESFYPPRHLCTVCGFFSNYQCVSCGARYCSLKCMDVHAETRCLKWNV